MIGVVVGPAEQDVVREFFELFKTPWEFYRENRHYEVVLCAGDHFEGAEKVVLFFAGRETSFDRQRNIPLGHHRTESCILSYQGRHITIYGESITFADKGASFLTNEESREVVAYLRRYGERVLARIGYGLFGEVRTLLTAGQPVANAGSPTLELHIALLRDLITACGVSLVEIPPVPSAHQFIACLTHDVDHPSIGSHKLDHTICGFLFRAIIGSLFNVVRGRTSFRDLLANWAAALKLPFVYLGVAEDFWREFDDRYLKLEKGLPSTFFFIPFKDYPGKSSRGLAPKFRAARYAAKDLAVAIQKLSAAGCEIGLHGIDAWQDSSKGSSEMREIREMTGASEIGVRMHWLYYDQHSPRVLEKAGAAYDSTIGYNETVGYRAGTTQAYKPLDAIRLLELPMHVMDTALFYPEHLGLSSKDARPVLERILDNTVQYGGCLTVNWHDRSLAPERLWRAPYRDLVRDMKTRGAWFATVGQAVSWFRKRRSVEFEVDVVEPLIARARVPECKDDNLPALRLRIHKAREFTEIGKALSGNYVDFPIDNGAVATVPSSTGK